MNWSLIVKQQAPTTGTYTDWKPFLRSEGFYRCVYCSIHEGSFGGLRNFHVEHFRPKSKFAALENHYPNLFYCCAICNSFKGDEWIEVDIVPAPIVSCFPDPSLTDFSSLFWLDASGTLAGKGKTGEFLAVQLFLNRPQLVIDRRVEMLRKRCIAELDESGVAISAAKELDLPEVCALALTLAELITSLAIDVLKLPELRPYEPNDVSR